MRFLLRIGLCCLVAGSMMAQRRGVGGGGFHGGGMGGFRGGGFRTGMRGGFFGGYLGGFYGYGGPGYSNYPYYDYPPYISLYPSYSYPAYGYNASPNVTVIYPSAQQAAAPAYSAPAQPVSRNYDRNYGDYGQRVQSGTNAASPIYLIATNDQTIRAAASYWVDGRTLHYVTLQHEAKQVPLDTVDRALTLQLNRERRVPFQLPQ
jgi:hypothetical protein